MADLFAVADVDLVVVFLGGLAVHWVVEVHALGVAPPPVAPDQVASGARQGEDHCGKDRNCMRLTHSRHTARALTQPEHTGQRFITHTYTVQSSNSWAHLAQTVGCKMLHG